MSELTFKAWSLIHLLVWLVSAHFANSILEHCVLLEEVVHRHFTLGVIVHWTLQIEAQEVLIAILTSARCQV